MTIRIISNHEPVIIYSADRKPIQAPEGFFTISFSQFVGYLLNTCDSFNKTGLGIRTAVRIERAFEKPLSSDSGIELSTEDWKMLAEACENPTGGYPVVTVDKDGVSIAKFNTAHSILPFIECIANAKEK